MDVSNRKEGDTFVVVRWRQRVIILALGFVLLAPWVHLGNLSTRGEEDSLVQDVRCLDPEGCFRLLERAITEASPGTVLRIHQGLYYEKPLTIEKSLTLQGEGNPEIRIVDPGVGLFIHLPQQEDNSMAVTLEGLTISVHRDRGGPKGNIGIIILGIPLEEMHEHPNGWNRLQVFLKDCKIQGFMGIRIEGATLQMEDCSIEARAFALYSLRSKLEITKSAMEVESASEDNPFLEDVLVSGMGILQSQLLLQESRVIGGVFGIALGMGSSVVLVESTVGGAFIGVFVTDTVTAEFQENMIWNNTRYGIALPLEGCAAHPTGFQGTIRGFDNEFRGNGQDLCPPPSDYPWPENFKKSP